MIFHSPSGTTLRLEPVLGGLVVDALIALPIAIIGKADFLLAWIGVAFGTFWIAQFISPFLVGVALVKYFQYEICEVPKLAILYSMFRAIVLGGIGFSFLIFGKSEYADAGLQLFSGQAVIFHDYTISGLAFVVLGIALSAVAGWIGGAVADKISKSKNR